MLPGGADTARVTTPETLRGLVDSTRAVVAAALTSLVTRRGMQDARLRDQVQALLAFAPPETIAHPQLRIIERHQLAITRGLSFHQIMIQRSEARRIGVRDRAWLLDDKAAGYRFADAFGIRHPVADMTPRPLAELEPQAPVVVKPANSTGARGVFLVHPPERVVEVRTGNELGSWSGMVERGRALVGSRVRPIRDRWITEELILDDHGQPARDLKFFCFYGRVAFVLEIERLPTIRRCWWDSTGQPTTTGKPSEMTDGHGITEEQVKLVEAVSLAIPAPFMRIDMLASDNGLVLGEFTPRPGQFEEFDAATDRAMGEAWVRAERRLLDDALAGVKFDTFDLATDG